MSSPHIENVLYNYHFLIHFLQDEMLQQNFQIKVS